jgi:adiponectin receptor
MARDQGRQGRAPVAESAHDDTPSKWRGPMAVAEALLGADDAELIHGQLAPLGGRRPPAEQRPESGRSDDLAPSTSSCADAAIGTGAPGRKQQQQREGGGRTAAPPPIAAAAAGQTDDDADAATDPPLPYLTNLSFQDAPDHVRFPHLLSGYRSGGTYTRNLAALFELHTETLNAWTMLVGVLLSVWQLRMALSLSPLPSSASSSSSSGTSSSSNGGADLHPPHHPYPHPHPPHHPHSLRAPQNWRESLPFWALTLSCAAHAPFSVGFHMFRGMGPRTYNLWRRLDQAFIFLASVPMAWALAAWARGGPFGEMGGGSGGGADSWALLGGSPAASATALIALVVALWAVAVVAALKPGFRRDKRQMVLFVATIVACYWAPMAAQAWHDLRGWWRAVVATGGHATAPPSHFFARAAASSLSPSSSPSSPTVVIYHGMGAARAALGVLLSLLAGAATYATGWPERRRPGTFDIWGSSHQLMHVGVVCAHAYKHAFLRELWRRRCVEEAMMLELGGGLASGGVVFAAPPAAELGPLLAPGATLASSLGSVVALTTRMAGALAASLEQWLRQPSWAAVAGGGGGGATITSPAAVAALAMALAVLLPRAVSGRASALVSSSSSGGSPSACSTGEEAADEGACGGPRPRPRMRRRPLAA